MQTVTVRTGGGSVMEMDVSPSGIRRELFVNRLRDGGLQIVVDGVELGIDAALALIGEGDDGPVVEPAPIVEPAPEDWSVEKKKPGKKAAPAVDEPTPTE